MVTAAINTAYDISPEKGGRYRAPVRGALPET
jgi:hypothetical protein